VETRRKLLKQLALRQVVLALRPNETILDPVCGTCGFLVGAAQYGNENHHEALLNQEAMRHRNHEMFKGLDVDNTMLRVGGMNMLLPGVENPDVRHENSLSELHSELDKAYSLVLINPPFAGSLGYEGTAQNLLQVVKTKRQEHSR
jgi:type I restriction enzyme M protein